MDVVGDTADAVGLAVLVAAGGGEVGVKFLGDVGGDGALPVFGGEDDVDDDFGERLGHFFWWAYEVGLQPTGTWGWYEFGLWPRG